MDARRRKAQREAGGAGSGGPIAEAGRLVAEIRAGWPIHLVEFAAVLGDAASRLAAPAWGEMEHYLLVRVGAIGNRTKKSIPNQMLGLIANELAEDPTTSDLVNDVYEASYERAEDFGGTALEMDAEVARTTGDFDDALMFIRLYRQEGEAFGARKERERQVKDLVDLLTCRAGRRAI